MIGCIVNQLRVYCYPVTLRGLLNIDLGGLVKQ